MWKLLPNLPTDIVTLTLNKYKALGKQGKPLLHSNSKAEWTVLASVAMVHCPNRNDHSIQIISLGTGLKCLPYSKLSKEGDVIHDNHAEVIARRGFIKYCLDQLRTISSGTGPFMLKDGRVIQNSDYSFHMYISQAPCGDASMSALSESQSTESYESFQAGSKRKRKVEYPFLMENTYLYKKQKVSNDQFQRGRFGFDQLGILRTKPGRLDSEPTLSMSCSDKIARWNVLGLQSSLLSNLFDPIYLDSIIIGDMYDEEALKRALYDRLSAISDLPTPYRLNQPLLFHTSISFESSKVKLESDGMTTIACNTALLWVEGMPKSEVYVHGRKQGAPKGKPSNAKTRPSICKLSLFEQFVKMYSTLTCLDKENMRYKDWKLKSKLYQEAKLCLLDQIFETWIQTPSDYDHFSISI